MIRWLPLCALALGCGGPALGPYTVGARAAQPAQAGALREVAQPALGAAAATTPVRVDSRRLANGVPVFVLTRREMPTATLALVSRPRTDGWQPLDVLYARAAECAVYRHDDGRSGKALEYWDSRHSIDASAAGTIAWSSYLAPLAVAGLDLWLDYLGSPSFDGNAMKCAARRVESQRETERSSEWLARHALLANVFPGGHPRGAWAADDLAKLDAARVREHAAGVFDPSRSAIVAAGDITMAEVVEVAEQRWGKRAAQAKPEPSYGGALPPRQRLIVTDTPTDDGVFVALGAVGVDPSDPQFAAQRVALVLLNDALFRRLRIERGEVYALELDEQLGRFAGLASLGVHVPAARAQATLSTMAEVMQELTAAPLPAGRIEEGKRAARQDFLAALDSNDGSALWLARVWSAGLDPSQLTALAGAVDGVDAGAVQRYLSGRWSKAQVSYAVVGPLGEAKAQLQLAE